MALKFCANVTTMFREYQTIAKRIAQAKSCGFKYIEVVCPYEESKEEIGRALKESDIKCAFMNAWPGPGHLSITVSPAKVEEFKDKLNLSLDYARALGCDRMHVLAGIIDDQFTLEQIEDTYVRNMQYAADMAAKENVTVLVEAVNSILTAPGYFVDSPDKALELIKKIDRPNVKFQLDIFHLQVTSGNLTHNIKKYLPYTDHVQISQAPDRHEPNSEGEINYRYVLNELVKAGYDGYVGLEYMPIGDTRDGLKWIEEFGYKL